MLEAGKRKCRHCNRWFANGKSLGGHMKAHLSLTCPKPATPGAGTSSSSQPQSQKKRKEPISATTGADYICTKCGESFPSWRSYLHHIRWHKSVENDPNSKISSIDEHAIEDAQIHHAAHLLIALSNMKCSCKFVPVVNFKKGIIGSELVMKELRCPVCRKPFATEKGLECHMKLAHKLPVPTKGAGNSQVVQEEKPELGFDLNVVPPMNYGHASGN